MTIASRKRTLIGFLLLLCVGNVVTVVLIVQHPPTLSLSQLFAATGSILSTVIGTVAGISFIRLFRRSPSVSVFFVTLSFVLIMSDGLKLAQLLAVAQSLPRVSVVLSRVLIAGNLLWVSALAGAGLYAGGVRMQRHGTAIVSVLALVAILATAVPLDTGTLPENLIHSTGLRASLDVIIAMFAAIAVLNYVYAAVNDRSARRLISALAVAVIAFGREGLFYLTDPLPMISSAAMLVAGAIVFAFQHYREQILG